MIVGWSIFVQSWVGLARRDSFAGVFRGKHSDAHAWVLSENAAKRAEQCRFSSEAPRFRIVATVNPAEMEYAESKGLVLNG